MATSGNFNTKTFNGELGARYLQFAWEVKSQDTDKNTTTISWTLKGAGGGSYYYKAGNFKLVINGDTVYSSSERIELYKGTVVASGTKKITHTDDGTKSFKVSAEAGIYYSTVNSTGSETFDLPDIPRYATVKQTFNSKTETTIKMDWSSDSVIDYLWYSTDNGVTWKGKSVDDKKSGNYTISGLNAYGTYEIKTKVRRKDSGKETISSVKSVTTYDYPHCTESPNFIIGEKVTLKFYNPLKRTFKFYIIGIGKTDGIVYNCSGTEYGDLYSSSSLISYLYNSIPNDKSGIYQVKVVYTDLDGNHTKTRNVGNTYSIVEKDCYPDFTTFTYVNNSSQALKNIVGENLVKDLSSINVVVPVANKMTAKNGAKPNRYVATIGTLNKSLDYSNENNVSVFMGTIHAKDTQRITVTAYDSRELSKQAHKDVPVYDYAKPVIHASVKRQNNFEAKSTLSVGGEYSPLTINGVNKNAITSVKFRSREVGGTWDSWTILTTTLNNGKFTCNDVPLSLDNAKAFEFEVQATDTIIDALLMDAIKTSATVDVGQSIFFISSNKKTAYLNGEEVTTRDNVRETKYYTQLVEGTDLNKITEIGTYRSIQASHTATMKNVPNGFNGGFTMYVYTWTATPTNTQYRRQEIVYARQTYIRNTNDGGTTWTKWYKVGLVEDIIDLLYPIGSVYCNSKNENPSKRLGGYWYLADKGFITFTTDGNLENPLAYFTPASNVTCNSCYVSRNHSTVRIRLSLTVDVAMTDAGMDLGTFKWSTVGITSLPMGYVGQTSYSDGANGGIVWSLDWTTGKLTQTDVFDITPIPAESTFYFDMTFVMTYDRMLDSCCDKFYFERAEDPNT